MSIAQIINPRMVATCQKGIAYNPANSIPTVEMMTTIIVAIISNAARIFPGGGVKNQDLKPKKKGFKNCWRCVGLIDLIKLIVLIVLIDVSI